MKIFTYIGIIVFMCCFLSCVESQIKSFCQTTTGKKNNCKNQKILANLLCCIITIYLLITT